MPETSKTRFDVAERSKDVVVAAPTKYPDELCERAVRLSRESDPKPVIRKLAERLNVHHEALRNDTFLAG